MKRFKALFATLAVASLVVAAFAFSSKKAPVFYDYQRAKNIITITDPNHLVVSELADATTASWVLGTSQVSGSSNELMQISFDDSQLTIAQAATGVANYYSANSTLPANGGTVTALDGNGNARNVTIFRAP